MSNYAPKTISFIENDVSFYLQSLVSVDLSLQIAASAIWWFLANISQSSFSKTPQSDNPYAKGTLSVTFPDSWMETTLMSSQLSGSYVISIQPVKINQESYHQFRDVL